MGGKAMASGAPEQAPHVDWDSMPEFLTPEEAAGALRISSGHMYDCLKDGTMPSVKLGRIYRIPTRKLRELAGA